jgi:hypothetical protein
MSRNPGLSPPTKPALRAHRSHGDGRGPLRARVRTGQATARRLSGCSELALLGPQNAHDLVESDTKAAGRCANTPGHGRPLTGGIDVSEVTPALSTGTTGAIAEMVVCVDLLRRGWAAFRAVSPSCPCDVIAMRDSQVHRIEVRTGHREGPRRSVAVPLREADRGRFDILAVILGGQVMYLPDFVDVGPTFPIAETPLRRLVEWGVVTPEAARVVRDTYPPAVTFAKLNPELVREIRARVDAGESRKSVARDIGISFSVVGQVAARKSWRLVEDEPA